MADGARIDVISAYCDRWCERCQFTARCSLFACTASIAMCGDVRDGIHLAIGAPPVPGESRQGCSCDESVEPALTQADVDAAICDEKVAPSGHRDNVAHAALLRYFERACKWIDAHQSALARDGSDPVLHEAGQIVTWDATFVVPKLHRALDGRYRAGSADEQWDDDPVQNDWNGSAKIALLCVQRSGMAWQTIADAWLDSEAAALAAMAGEMMTLIEREFANVWSFVRPGFDGLPSA